VNDTLGLKSPVLAALSGPVAKWFLRAVSRRRELVDQLDRASISVLLNTDPDEFRVREDAINE
jgi:hypothetical protein